MSDLTKRERFAESAMKVLMQNYRMSPELGTENFKVLAEAARNMADAMVDALGISEPKSIDKTPAPSAFSKPEEK